jgi:hypothetical protein
VIVSGERLEDKARDSCLNPRRNGDPTVGVRETEAMTGRAVGRATDSHPSSPFLYVGCDVPEGMTLDEWRRRRAPVVAPRKLARLVPAARRGRDDR